MLIILESLRMDLTEKLEQLRTELDGLTQREYKFSVSGDKLDIGK